LKRSLILRLINFVRKDLLWVLSGQMIALLVGLVNLKVLTNLFDAKQYAYIALMMALSAWIWSGIYQPLNQTIFRFYSLAKEQAWQPVFFESIKRHEKKLIFIILFLSVIIACYGVLMNQPLNFFLLIFLSIIMGIVYGRLHGIVSLFMAQRYRKPVTFIQSFDGMFRLVGGLIAFYWVDQTEYVTATGMVIAGGLFLIVVKVIVGESVQFDSETQLRLERADKMKYTKEFEQYFKSSFVILLLNATVTHLDKWLLVVLMGHEHLGKYAIVYLLAMTIMSVVYFFFEMLGFPIIFNEKCNIRRKSILRTLLFNYSLCVMSIVTVSYYHGQSVLLFFTNHYVAGDYIVFTLLMTACGLLNFGRILMVEGQVEKQPNRYWPSYIGLLVFFVMWCAAFVTPETGSYNAAMGLVFATVIFIVTTVLLNLKSTVIKETDFER